MFQFDLHFLKWFFNLPIWFPFVCTEWWAEWIGKRERVMLSSAARCKLKPMKFKRWTLNDSRDTISCSIIWIFRKRAIWKRQLDISSHNQNNDWFWLVFCDVSRNSAKYRVYCYIFSVFHLGVCGSILFTIFPMRSMFSISFDLQIVFQQTKILTMTMHWSARKIFFFVFFLFLFTFLSYFFSIRLCYSAFRVHFPCTFFWILPKNHRQT